MSRSIVIVTLAAAVVAMPAESSAQWRTARLQGAAANWTDTRPFGAGFVELGGMRGSFGDLSRELNAHGFAAPHDGALTLGFGGYRLHDDLLVGAEVQGALWQTQGTADGRETGLAAGTGMLNVGYTVVHTTRWLLYPLGGVGVGGVQLDLRDRSGTGLGPRTNDPTFAEVLTDPGHHARLNRAAIVASLGAGLDFVARSPNYGATGGMLIGVRAGYLFNPGSSRWSLYDEDVIGGPAAKLAGPYVKVSIGGGGTRPAR